VSNVSSATLFKAIKLSAKGAKYESQGQARSEAQRVAPSHDARLSFSPCFNLMKWVVQSLEEPF
jgi:hypothetical protein